MDRLTAAITVIGTFFGGVFGNIIAHDFCEFTPKICRRLIERAVQVLPSNQRQERLEEWLAHLNDCTTVSERFKHAITCMFGARALRNIPVGKTILAARVQFAGMGVINLDLPTTLVAMHFFKNIGTRFKPPKKTANRYIKLVYLLWLLISAFFAAIYTCRKCGRVDGKQLNKLISMIIKAIREKNNQIVVEVGNIRLDVAKIAKGEIPNVKSIA